ncbi:MAG: hypothetical protein AAGC60_09445 [Acidobacteriota bacterium]
MTTTHLFVELLVIGLGALIWLGLLVAGLFGYEVGPLRGTWLSLETIFPLLTIAYLVGILVDRAADFVFSFWDGRLLAREFGGSRRDKTRYYELRRTLISEAPELWKHLEYGRSRLRICRGWFVNAVLIASVLTAACAFGRPLAGIHGFHLFLGDLLLLVLAMGCAACWYELNRKEYRKINRQAPWIEQRERQASRTLRRLRRRL